MMWEKKSLVDFVWFQRGFDLPKDNFILGEFPVVGSTSILGFHNEGKVKAPCIVTGRSGTLGKFQFINTDFWPHNTTLWVKDFFDNDKKFAYYLLQTLDFNSLNAGGAVPTLNRNFLSSIIVNVPPLPTQRRIAAILSSYDDLIENNMKRIKLLEEQAFLRYKEIVRNEELIEGKIGDLADVKSGFAFKGSDWTNEGFPVIKIKNIGNNDIDLIDCSLIPENIAEVASKFKLNEGDLLIAMTGATVGKIGMMPRTDTNFYLNQRVGIFKPKRPNAELYLFCFFNEIYAQTAIINLASGAAQPNISGSQIESIKLKIPSLKVLSDFGKMLKYNFEMIRNLRHQNAQLRKSRDILLPKLMNGEIVV